MVRKKKAGKPKTRSFKPLRPIKGKGKKRYGFTRIKKRSLRRRKTSDWASKAYTDAIIDGMHFSADGKVLLHEEMNRSWHEWARRTGFHSRSGEYYQTVASHYLNGFCQRAGLSAGNLLLWATSKSASAVVSVMNEEATLDAVIDQLERLPLRELIVVVNGSKDKSFSIARNSPKTRIVYYPEALGHDVGRAVGAKLTDTQIVLFMDGDIPLRAEQLLPFAQAVEEGADVVLNDISRQVGLFYERDSVTIIKEFLNHSLGRPDLRMNSLTAVPHVLTRKALDAIGIKNLAVPPVANALAIRQGLNIKTAAGPDVVSGNRLRKGNSGRQNPVSDMIVGDHLEALAMMMEQQGERLHFPDHIRKRSQIGGAVS